MSENDPTRTEEDAQRWLRQTLMAFARDLTEAQADAMLDATRRGWNIETFTKFAKLVQVASPAALTPAGCIFWLDATLRMIAAPNGRELVFAAGMRVADVCGVAAELLDTLRARVTPKRETGH